MIGKTLGHYRVVAKIGAGGMGEVYRATDAKLGRDVALKVLPEAFACDTGRMARFEREAKVLASLNHSNVASIYGLEESSGIRALVMELVEGLTLAERIKSGPIALDEALPISRQMAEALEYAHERGIIHRDLKPANVKVTPEGTVKVLDFGLAKALEGETTEEEISNSPTLTAAATRAGMLLGTAAYMSPEQARAKRVDRRADIWAFGCVLYEMLTGKQAFSGETTSDTLAAVIRAEPDWNALPAGAPAGIRNLLRRCLEKDPKQRLRDIGEARIAVETAIKDHGAVQVGESSPPALAGKAADRRRRLAIYAVLAVVMLAIGFSGRSLFESAAPPAPAAVRFEIPTPPGFFLNILGTTRQLAVSPDGTGVVFVGRGGPRAQQLFLREMNSFQSTPIPGTERRTGGLWGPSFSPDGQWVSFLTLGGLEKAPLGGGATVSLCALSGLSYDAAWGPNQNIYFSEDQVSGLMRVSAQGGTPQSITTPRTGEGDSWPQPLPGGKTLLVTVSTGKGSYNNARIEAVRLDTGVRRTLIEGGTDPRFVPPDYLVYARDGNLMAVRLDPERLEILGTPVPVIEDVAMSPESGAAGYDVSQTGTLVYMSGTGLASDKNSLVWMDRGGKVEPLGLEQNTYQAPRFSPDGRKLAVTLRLPDPDIWVYDLERGTLRRMTFAPGEDEVPLWSPDGKQIAYASNGRKQAFLVPADGSAAERSLAAIQNHFHPDSWSPDGKLIALEQYGGPGGKVIGIWMLPTEGDHKPYPYLQTQFDEAAPAFSPDGRWLAYGSDESGRYEVYVRRFPGPGEKVQVSTGGGSYPVWARNGGELFYVNGDTMMAAGVTTGSTFTAGKPRALFEGQFWDLGSGPNYDVAPDGKRFMVVERSKESAGSHVNVVLNWTTELQNRLPLSKH